MTDVPHPKSSISPAPLALWVLPAVLVIAIPALWWTWADAPFPLRPDLVLTMSLFVALVTISVFAVLSHGFRRRIRWSLGVTTVVVAMGFQWPALVSVGTLFSEVTGLALLGDITPVLVAGVIIWLATRLADDWYFAAGACVLAISAVLFLGANAFQSIPSALPSTPLETAAGPDVLLIVLDAYARADLLEAEFGFDNSEFLTELESRGFSIAAEATSNYARTYASLATMLNLDYVFDEGGFDDAEWELMRSTLTGRTGFIQVFDSVGYETVYFENAWGGSQCGPNVDRCIRDGLVERSLWNISQMTIFAPLMREIRPDPFNSVSHDHLRSLVEVVSAPTHNDEPRLTVAHTLLPHAPLLLNADCTREPQDELRRWGSDPTKLDTRRRNYGQQTSCVNSLVLEAVDGLLARDPAAIVIITADHGPASTLDWDLPFTELTDEAILERMAILSAYRFPGCEEPIRADLTPVNGFRIAMNCAIGTNLDELPDENYWVATKTDPVVPITPLLRRETAP